MSIEDMEFWAPLTVLPRTVSTIGEFPPVPDMVELCGDDSYLDQVSPWVPVTGKSGQDRYRGPLFHPSEFIGEGLMRWMHENPGQYVTVPVDDVDGEPAGWLLLYHEGK